MKKRLMSATAFILILAIAFILKIFVSNYFFDIAILFVACLASYETSKLLTKMGRYNDKYMASIFPATLMLVLLLCVGQDSSLGLVYTIILAVALILFMTAITFAAPFITYKSTKAELKTRKMDNLPVWKYALTKALNTAMVFVYPAFLIMFLLLTNHIEDMTSTFEVVGGHSGNLSFFVLLLAFLIPVFTDTFAYLTGGIFGGKKLAPKISPNKTISGAVGGLLWCVLLSIAVFCIFNSVPTISTMFESTGITLWKVAIISALGSILGQVGDLFESYMKRSANVKDSGKIMPGHGGMLDRFDSHVFVAPFVFIAFSILFLI